MPEDGEGRMEMLAGFAKEAGHAGEFHEIPVKGVIERMMEAEIFSNLECCEKFLVINGTEWFSGEKRKIFARAQADKQTGEHIAIPDGYTDIWKEAFGNRRRNAPREEIKHIVIPDGVKRIWDRAFAGCVRLESVYIPDSVARIENNAFGFWDASGYWDSAFDPKIYCRENSRAMAYAQKKRIKFQLVD
jgi:hypothetical protein